MLWAPSRRHGRSRQKVPADGGRRRRRYLAGDRKAVVLLPAEGQGRNAVFAARLGWEVFAFDNSEVGRHRALELAKKHEVSINYDLKGYDEVEFPEHFFDVIGLVFAHHPQIHDFHPRMLSFLKPGGSIILEGFSKDQISRNTGGPQNLNMLFSEEEILGDFKVLSNHEIWSGNLILHEGKYHQGEASVVRYFGRK